MKERSEEDCTKIPWSYSTRTEMLSLSAGVSEP